MICFPEFNGRFVVSFFYTVYSSIFCSIGPLSTHKDVLVTDCMAVLVMKRALSKRSLVAMALLKKSGYVMSCSKLRKEVNVLWLYY